MRGALPRLLVMVVALVATAPDPAYAGDLARTVQWRAEYRIEIDGPTRLCKGVEAKFTVRVIRYGVGTEGDKTTYLDWGDTATTLHVSVDGESSPLQTRASSSTTYRRTFRAVGTHTLTFSADFNQVPVGVTAYPLEPLTFQVEVVDCNYKITTMSVWIMPFGWRPWMGAIMQQVTMVPTGQDTPEYRATGTLENVAIPQYRPCAVNMTVSPVDVTLHGLASFVRDIRTSFALDLSYAPGTIGAAGTDVTCPHGLNGGQKDTFALDPLYAIFPPEGGSELKQHVLHAIKLGDIVGRTVIVVTQENAP